MLTSGAKESRESASIDDIGFGVIVTVKMKLRFDISFSRIGFEGLSECDASRKGYATRIRSEYQFAKLKWQAQLDWIRST